MKSLALRTTTHRCLSHVILWFQFQLFEEMYTCNFSTVESMDASTLCSGSNDNDVSHMFQKTKRTFLHQTRNCLVWVLTFGSLFDIHVNLPQGIQFIIIWYWTLARICSWNQHVLGNEGNVSSSRKSGGLWMCSNSRLTESDELHTAPHRSSLSVHRICLNTYST